MGLVMTRTTTEVGTKVYLFLAIFFLKGGAP